MTRVQHLLTIMSEECNEVAQRISKALRFSLREVQPGQHLNNAQRIKQEMLDLMAVYGMLCKEGFLEPIAPIDQAAIDLKQDKVEKYLDYSDECGMLDPDEARF